MTRLAFLVLVALAALSAPPALDAHPGDGSRAQEGIAPSPAGPGVSAPIAAAGAVAAAPAFDRDPGTAPATSQPPASPASRDAAGGLVVALLLILAAGALGARRIVVLAGLAAMLAFAFETGLHSVHHLGEPSGASECAVATAASTVAAVADAPPTWTAAPAPGPAVPADIDVPRPPVSSPAPFQGRAPPPR